MNVAVYGIGLVASGAAGAIDDFKPRQRVPDRKHLKLMTRDVRLGIAAMGDAVRAAPGWLDVPPERRGLFVGGTPAASDPAEIGPAMAASMGPDGLDVAAFGELGVPRVPPLWLVKGLSNNIGGFGSMYHDIRGHNTNRCDGRAGGLAAVLDGARAVAEGRVGMAVCGGADSLVHASSWLPLEVGEGAAFLVLGPEDAAPPNAPRVVDGGMGFDVDGGARPSVDLGAATGVVELARRLLAGERGFAVHASDSMGPTAWVAIG